MKLRVPGTAVRAPSGTAQLPAADETRFAAGPVPSYSLRHVPVHAPVGHDASAGEIAAAAHARAVTDAKIETFNKLIDRVR